MIQQESIQFLTEIKKNNNRDWFEANKDRYLEAKKNIEEFASEVEKELSKSDVIEKVKLYRIYRDVRFSKDKTPYKTYFHLALSRAGKERRGGYYIGIEPGNSAVGGGFYGPEKEDLLRIRQELEFNGDEFHKIITDTNFKKYFPKPLGESLVSAPKGFDKDHKHIEYIRMKQYYFMRNFSDNEVCSESFLEETVNTLKAIRPFFDLMSEVLTTDLNGEKII